jgi:dTDP-glucose 4,6-dehydratase
MPQNRSIIAEDVSKVLDQLQEYLRPLCGTTLLITGASGFLCSYFVEIIAALNVRTSEQPCRVIAVDNFRSSLKQRISHLLSRQDVHFVRHDVSLPLELNEKVDWIIHGASIASPTFYRLYPLETIDVNVNGSRHLLEQARQHGCRSMLYVSSSEIYGDPDVAAIPTPEEYRGNVSCTGPRACYDESKRMAETLCTIYHRLYNVPVKIVRPFNIYGPGQRLDDRRIVPDLMTSALEHKPLTLLSDGRASRCFCYITDAIRAMFHILLSGANGDVFNVGNDERETTIVQLAEAIRQVAGPPSLPIEFRSSTDKHYLTDNPQRRCPDLRKLRSRFNWKPEVSLLQGLRRTFQFYEIEAIEEQLAPNGEAT